MNIWLGLAVWVSLGPVLAVVMGRLGYSPAGWGLLGMMLGPLAVPAAIGAIWHRAAGPVDIVMTAAPGPGQVSVLVGVDGSDYSLAALEQAVALVGDRIGRLTLATVVSFDGADPHAQAWLDGARAAVPGLEPEEVLATGDAAATLTRLAEDGGYDLVVVGSCGRGLSPRFFGSVARTMATHSPVPVMIGGQHHRAGLSSADPTAGDPARQGAVS